VSYTCSPAQPLGHSLLDWVLNPLASYFASMLLLSTSSYQVKDEAPTSAPSRNLNDGSIPVKQARGTPGGKTKRSRVDQLILFTIECDFYISIEKKHKQLSTKKFPLRATHGPTRS
jgi:hypothetical protein